MVVSTGNLKKIIRNFYVRSRKKDVLPVTKTTHYDVIACNNVESTRKFGLKNLSSKYVYRYLKDFRVNQHVFHGKSEDVRVNEIVHANKSKKSAWATSSSPHQNSFLISPASHKYFVYLNILRKEILQSYSKKFFPSCKSLSLRHCMKDNDDKVQIMRGRLDCNGNDSLEMTTDSIPDKNHLKTKSPIHATLQDKKSKIHYTCLSSANKTMAKNHLLQYHEKSSSRFNYQHNLMKYMILKENIKSPTKPKNHNQDYQTDYWNNSVKLQRCIKIESSNSASPFSSLIFNFPI